MKLIFYFGKLSANIPTFVLSGRGVDSNVCTYVEIPSTKMCQNYS
jgi:hypothetical protein